jgi:predicted amidohydrolase YtcJ
MFDTIFVGGRAFTAGWASSRPLGVGVRGGRIAAVAGDDELRDAGAVEIVDLRGGIVMPSFQDAHAHPVQGAIELLRCDVSEAVDADDCLARIARYAAHHPEEEWILGGGWSMPHFPGGTPARELLDAIVPDRPVALSNRDHHGVWVNTRALELAGISAATADPADGRIERAPDGSPAGVLHEGAERLLDAVRPAAPRDLTRRALERAQHEFFALGLTGWQDAWVGVTTGTGDLLDVYLDGVARGVLRSRVSAALWWERGEGLAQLDGLLERRARVEALGRPDVLRAATIKIMVDGVAENFTAAMSRPYLDAEGGDTGHSGLTFVDADELVAAVTALDAAGFDVHLHALGDRAVTMSLDALSEARWANGRRPARHQLAHLQVVQRSDVARFKQLGAIANLQMLWGAVDDQLAELTFPFLAQELIARHYPLRELRDAGAPLAAGSDWPVSTADPLAAIHVGVNRAVPGGVADPRMDPEQALDVVSAFTAYTAGSAHANGWGDSTGALADGYLADLVVLDADPFTLAPERLHDVAVRETRLAGDRLYAGVSA